VAGPDRAIVYRLALGTGFRASELRSLRPESFDLDSDPPTVTVGAAYSKRRRKDRQPIRSDLADALRRWLADKPQGERLFSRLPSQTARMLRGDLEAARRAWIDEARTEAERQARERSDFLAYRNAAGEVADFHATRHTHISGIVAGGASVKTAQELARHADPSLTIGRYSHARLHHLQGALETLPGLAHQAPASQAEPPALRATGTNGATGREHKQLEKTAANTLDRLLKCGGQKRGQWQGEPVQKPAIPGGRHALCSHTAANVTERHALCNHTAANVTEAPQVVAMSTKRQGRRPAATAGEKAEGRGLEPPTGKPAPDFESATTCVKSSGKARNSEGVGAIPGAVDPAPRPIDPGLALVIKRWESLPEAVRAGIVAMAKAAAQKP
jgi:hypothetical protein